MFAQNHVQLKRFGHAELLELTIEFYRMHQQLCGLRLVVLADLVDRLRHHHLLRNAR